MGQKKSRTASFIFGLVAGGVILGALGMASPHIPVSHTENMKLVDFKTELDISKGVNLNITEVKMRNESGLQREFNARGAQVDGLHVGEALVTGRGFSVTYSEPLSNMFGLTHEKPQLRSMTPL